MNHLGTKELHTPRLTLRQIRPDDARDLFAWMGDPEVCRWERWTPHESADYSRGYIMAVYHYDDIRVYNWGIELEGRLIGSICVVNVDDFDEKAVMGYCLAREYWSRGYTTEAAREVLRFMFQEVGINRVEASHSINNPASGRVLEKAGFRPEGLAKEYFRSNEGFQDSRLFGITRKEYTAQ